jgi:hypothetical protein
VSRVPVTAAKAACLPVAGGAATPGGVEPLLCLPYPAGPGAYVNANRAGRFRAETDLDSRAGNRSKQDYHQQDYRQQGRGQVGADDIAAAANVRPPAMDHFELLALASEIAAARARRD